MEAGQSYLVENGLGLTTVTGLLAVITTLSLCEQRGLSCLVFCHVSVFARAARVCGATDG